MNRILLAGLVLLSFQAMAQREDMACYLHWQDGSDQVVTGTVANPRGLRREALNQYAAFEFGKRYSAFTERTQRHGSLQSIDCVRRGSVFTEPRANALLRITPR